MDNRSGKRFALGNIESFNFHTTNREVTIQFPAEISLKDISVGGLGIKSNVPLEAGITLSLNLELNSESYVVIGKIVWCKKSGNLYECGLKLIYMPETLIDQFSKNQDLFSKYSN